MLDTVKTLAAHLNCSEAFLRKTTRVTDMPKIRVGRAIRFEREAVLAWLRKQQEQQNEKHD